MSWCDVVFRGAATLLLAAAAFTPTGDARADDPPQRRDPYTGYAHPSGGQRGTTFRVTVGGQYLNNVKGVRVSGGGVRAKVVRYEGAYRRLNGEQRRELKLQLTEARRRLAGKAPLPVEEPKKKKKTKKPKPGKTPPAEKERPKLPRHPLLSALATLTSAELDQVERRFLIRDARRQPNKQIAETVLLSFTIEEHAEPGVRDLRLVTRSGLTNPIRFEIGTLREITNLDPPVRGRQPELVAQETPVLVNGQVLPGEIDRFRVKARRGQRLVVDAHARRLVPYLADAVPGWFQATVRVRDRTGAEVAFADDFRFDPDPVLLWEVAEDGEYDIEIADSIYRGREDFVYRISVGELPYATSLFPLGAPHGADAQAIVTGWNLDVRSIPLDTSTPGICFTGTPFSARPSNQLPYEIDTPQGSLEAEPNDEPADAQPLRLPRMIDGRIARPGDVDLYQFAAPAGSRVVARLHARRLRSPLDSLLEITDAAGRVIAWNDDHREDLPGLLTHDADSYVLATVPDDGVYRVRVSDLCGHGGDAYAYRLFVGAPRPDFSLAVTPSSVNIPASGSVPLTIRVQRRDGFDGELQLRLARPTRGFELDGGRVPAGCDRIRVTLRAPPGRKDWPRRLSLEASARIGERFVTHTAQPADDVMQAFLYRHLVPAEELAIAVTGRASGVSLVLPHGDRVRLGVGESVTVGVRAPRLPAKIGDLDFRLVDPVPGLRVSASAETDDGWEFELTLQPNSDRTTAPRKGSSPTEDNVIVEVVRTIEPPKRDIGKPRRRAARRVSLGYLPAIPLVITGE